MKSCPFTQQFKEQIACGNRDSYLMKYKDKYIAICDLVYNYGEYSKTDGSQTLKAKFYTLEF